ncbi:MAG: hypothetical protein AB1609_08160 [Bacillota bacterium]
MSRYLAKTLAVLMVAASVNVSTASASAAPPMALIPDVTAASGELDAMLLNPAAATGLKESSLIIKVTEEPLESGGSKREYMLAVVDPGGTLAGGLTGSLKLAPGEALEWRATYTIAGKLGPAALGVRGTWTGIDAPGPGVVSRWAADVGVSGRLGPSLWFGMAASNLWIGGPSPGAPRIAGRVSLTLAPPSKPVYLLSVGLSDEDLQEANGRVFDAGLLVPLGRYIRLVGRYEQGLEDGMAVRWAAGMSVDVTMFRLDAGYRSDGAYLVGIRSTI